ncbi:MAG: hypothetical protein ACE5RN_02935 [Nitrosopumilaceae archaeon]
MKIIAAFVLVALIFAPSSVFGWKSVNQLNDFQCTVNCNVELASIDYSKPMNFIMLGMFSLIGLGLFLKYNRLGKYETFSMKCNTCKRKTNGLKCPICEAEKQRAF